MRRPHHLHVRAEDLPEGVREEVAPTPRGPVRYIRRPGGPKARVVVGVPGVPTFVDDWLPFIARTSPERWDFRVVERPGYGVSAATPASDDMAHQVEAAHAALPEEGAAVLVGHSFGSLIALHAALEWPDRVAGVLSLSGPSDPDAFPVSTGAAFSAVGERALRAAAPNLPAGFARSMLLDSSSVRGHMLALNGRLPSLDLPVAVAHGDADPVVPFAHMAHREALLRRCVGARRIPGAKHNIVRTDPQACADALEALAAAL